MLKSLSCRGNQYEPVLLAKQQPYIDAPNQLLYSEMTQETATSVRGKGADSLSTHIPPLYRIYLNTYCSPESVHVNEGASAFWLN